MYLDLINVQKDMKGLRQIYDVFEAQKVNDKFRFYTDDYFFSHFGQYFTGFFLLQNAKSKWSQTLWVDLNIHQLQEGVETFIKTLRQLPKHVKALPVAFFLEGRMKEFQKSLPLLLDLKNEALRDRLDICCNE